jgi:hypothetical protein
MPVFRQRRHHYVCDVVDVDERLPHVPGRQCDLFSKYSVE